MREEPAKASFESAAPADEDPVRHALEIKAIYQTAPVGLCVLDTGLRFVRINERLAEINGPSVADHLGRTVREVLPHLADEAEPLLRQVLDTGRPVLGVEISGETPAQPGVTRTWVENWFPLKKLGGKVVGISVVAEETTERQRAERLLRESEARLRRLFQQAPALITLHEGPEHVYIFSNGLHDRAVGGRPLLGRSLREAMPELEGQGVFERFDRAYRTGEPVAAPEFKAVLGRGAEGGGAEEERHFSQMLQPWYGAGGEVAGVMSFAFEVTEQVRSRQKLEERERLLGAILDQMPSGVSVAEAPEGRLLLHNEEAVRLLRHPLRPSEDYTGYAQYGAVHPGGAPYAPEEYPIARALSGETVRQEAMRYRRGDGTSTVFLVNAAPVRDAAGEAVMAVSTFHDVGALKRAEGRLRALNEQLEARVERRTAEVRALASALTLAEQTERQRIARILHDDLQQQLYSVQIQFAVLEREAARLEAAPPALEASAVRLRRYVEEAIRTTRHLMVELSPPVLEGEGLGDALLWLRLQMEERFGLRVRLDLENGAAPAVSADDMRGLLFQIVRELLFNVVKHAKADEARVSIAQQGALLTIEVADRGAGFDPEAARRGDGGGFGLYGARERLKLFGGSLDVRSRPGEGTRVVVTLPTQQL